MIPHIRQADGQIGFSWVTPTAGRPRCPTWSRPRPSRPGWCRPTCRRSTTRRYPLTLDTLLRGSGVEKDGALDEHRAALTTVSALPAADGAGRIDPAVLTGAIEWMLYDWLMAHRES
ncbi:MAG TPA: hypothetical protein VIL16_16555, partial [Trebonia sp.]